jgi:superoxide dismutase, Cu-Zn family
LHEEEGMRGSTCLLAVAGLALAGCDGDTTATPVEREWQAQLSGAVGWEHLGGEATVVFVPGTGSFVAGAELTGDQPGAVRPWHVHFNTCAAGGGIVGQDGDYPRLVVGSDGRATATVAVTQPLQVGALYHVNVHLSNAELATIIACGDLVLVN